MGVQLNFLDALAEGMHIMAQPLTVLRATLEIASAKASTVSQFQHAVDSSLTEVTRVSEAMQFTHELVRIARDRSEAAPTDLVPVLATVQEDLGCVLDKAAITLELQVGEDVREVLASPSRLRQCLFYLVQHAVSVLESGGVIHVSGESDGDTIELELAVERSSPVSAAIGREGKPRWTGTARCLALANALAQASGEHLEWRTEPFAAWLSLPSAKPADRDRAAAGDSKRDLMKRSGGNAG